MLTGLPFCKMLGTEAVERVHDTGCRILETVGVRIADSKYRELAARAGARVDDQRERVFFDRGLLGSLLEKAPSRFTLHSRDGRNDLRMGEGCVYFGSGGRVFRILDMATGGYRQTLLRDVAHTAILVHNLPNIHFYIISCQAHDVGPEHYHLNDFYHAFNQTTKHVMGGCDNLEGMRQAWELACTVAGGADALRERPFFSIITNPISPLTVDPVTLGILRFCAERGIPATCAPAPISGATAPATLAGVLSQMHAEAMAGVALAQIFAPGAKVLYGSVATAMDLRTMEFCMGSVETAIMNAAAVQMAKRCDLPIYASGGLTEAKRPDIQSGVEKCFSNLMVALAGGDYIHLAAGMLDSGNSISYEQYVIDNEILGMIYRILAGIRSDEGALGFEAIRKVGPGGNYVMEDHTVEYMMTEFFYPELSVRCNFDIWEERGRPTMLSRARERVEALLKEDEEGLLDPDLIADIRRKFPGIQSI